MLSLPVVQQSLLNFTGLYWGSFNIYLIQYIKTVRIYKENIVIHLVKKFLRSIFELILQFISNIKVLPDKIDFLSIR